MLIMPKKVEVFILGAAQRVLGSLDQAHRAQFNRLVAALRLSPQAGVFYAKDGAGRVLYQVSGSDLHVIYTLTYLVQVDHVYIVSIDIAEWFPHHADMP
jgi:hypothetical protein